MTEIANFVARLQEVLTEDEYRRLQSEEYDRLSPQYPGVGVPADVVSEAVMERFVAEYRDVLGELGEER